MFTFQLSDFLQCTALISWLCLAENLKRQVNYVTDTQLLFSCWFLDYLIWEKLGYLLKFKRWLSFSAMALKAMFFQYSLVFSLAISSWVLFRMSLFSKGRTSSSVDANLCNFSVFSKKKTYLVRLVSFEKVLWRCNSKHKH